MKSIIEKLNLNEPSTHAGIAAVLVALSTIPALAPYALFLQGAAVLFGGAGVVKKEKK